MTELAEHRVCVREGCGQALVRRDGEKSNRFQDRECCSVPCANSVRQTRSAAARPVCALPGCGQHTNRPDRKYCSQEHSSQARLLGVSTAQARRWEEGAA